MNTFRVAVVDPEHGKILSFTSPVDFATGSRLVAGMGKFGPCRLFENTGPITLAAAHLGGEYRVRSCPYGCCLQVDPELSPLQAYADAFGVAAKVPSDATAIPFSPVPLTNVVAIPPALEAKILQSFGVPAKLLVGDVNYSSVQAAAARYVSPETQRRSERPATIEKPPQGALHVFRLTPLGLAIAVAALWPLWCFVSIIAADVIADFLHPTAGEARLSDEACGGK